MDEAFQRMNLAGKQEPMTTARVRRKEVAESLRLARNASTSNQAKIDGLVRETLVAETTINEALSIRAWATMFIAAAPFTSSILFAKIEPALQAAQASLEESEQVLQLNRRAVVSNRKSIEMHEEIVARARMAIRDSLATLRTLQGPGASSRGLFSKSSTEQDTRTPSVGPDDHRNDVGELTKAFQCTNINFTKMQDRATTVPASDEPCALRKPSSQVYGGGKSSKTNVSPSIFRPARLNIDLSKLQYGAQQTPPTSRKSRLECLPTELLQIILCEVPLSKSGYRNLVLTCSRIKDIVQSSSFRNDHLGKKMEPGIALFRDLYSTLKTGFTHPSKWIHLLLNHRFIVTTIAMGMKFNHLYCGLSSASASTLDWRTIISRSMKHLFTTAVAVLKFLHHLTRHLQAPSHESFQFMAMVVLRLLPKPLILLLRWAFYLFWLQFQRLGMASMSVPQEPELSKSYGPVPRPNPGNPQPSQASRIPPFGANLLLPETRCLFMVECALLFGPASGMISKLFNRLRGPLSGPFYWFLRDSALQVLSAHPAPRQMHDGRYIMFPALGQVFNKRYNELKFPQALEEPPVPYPPGWATHIERIIAESTLPIIDMIEEVDFSKVGRLLWEQAVVYLNEVEKKKKKKEEVAKQS